MSEKLGTNLAEVGTDTISRKQAIDALKEHRANYCDNTPSTFAKLSYAEKSRVDELDTAIATLVNLPPAQPEPNYDEWCTDCKEYDHENSCCPRWTKVIRQTRRELQDEFVMTAVDGTLWVTVDDVQKVGRVIVDEEKSKSCRQFYMDAQPQRTGYWYPVGVVEVVGGESAQWGSAIAYHRCSECDEQALRDDFEQEVLSKWCPHCGAKMVGVSE